MSTDAHSARVTAFTRIGDARRVRRQTWLSAALSIGLAVGLIVATTGCEMVYRVWPGATAHPVELPRPHGWFHHAPFGALNSRYVDDVAAAVAEHDAAGDALLVPDAERMIEAMANGATVHAFALSI